MKRVVTIIFIVIIIVVIIGIIYYSKINKSPNTDVVNNMPIQSETSNKSNNIENTEQKSSIEKGTTERRKFIIDNIYHSDSQGDIHFSSYYPENYDKTKKYAIYFALPGWEGLYFQGIGANMGEPFP